MDNTDNIKIICRFAAAAFSTLAAKGAKNNYTFDFDTRDLKNYLDVDIRNSEIYKSSEKFNPLLKVLNQITGPCIYWVEFNSDISNNDLLNRLLVYKGSKGCRAVPALKNTFEKDTTTLYVWKVKDKFWGRLIQHLGYHKTPATQGLQLYHWCKDISIRFKVHVYEF